MIPASTFDLLAQARDELKMSSGEIITLAIEQQLDALPALLNAGKRKGLFETRATRLPRRYNEPPKAITYRLTEQDLATIDDLVDQLGARSRAHLITVALNAQLTKAD